MAAVPRTVFGMPAYNHAHKLRDALDSILLQTAEHFRLIVSDDNSTDDTRRIAEEYAARDERIIYHRPERRLGYIGNARHCFELARQLFPQAEFFAWASDHDLWHPRWLEAMEQALDDQPDAVIACPLVQRIDADGSVTWTQPPTRQCSTAGEAPSIRRFSKAFNTMAAGNMVYGLMRAEAVETAGGLPWHLLPDRLFITLLSMEGSIVSVPEYLWYRRYRGLASIERQISASFLEGTPRHLQFPWWVAHSGHLLNRLVLAPPPNAPVGRWKGVGYSALYILLGAKHVLARSLLTLLYPLTTIQRRFAKLHPLKVIRRRVAKYSFLESVRRSAKPGKLLRTIRRRASSKPAKLLRTIRRRVVKSSKPRIAMLRRVAKSPDPLGAIVRRVGGSAPRDSSLPSKQAPRRDSAPSP